VGKVQLGMFVTDRLGFAVNRNQAQGFARYAEADRHLGAERPVPEILTERVENVAILLVTAVEAYFFACKAAADANKDFRRVVGTGEVPGTCFRQSCAA
jgi:hypothetical protein